jgi:hypothetical protein
MNSLLVKSVPQGDFAEVSVLKKDWEFEFLNLVGQKRAIRYDMYPLTEFPHEIRSVLSHQGYRDLILERDKWQHFLIPNRNEFLLSNNIGC